ncbi:hypothetical protein [Bradyrhizobium sp. USDA 4508]
MFALSLSIDAPTIHDRSPQDPIASGRAAGASFLGAIVACMASTSSLPDVPDDGSHRWRGTALDAVAQGSRPRAPTVLVSWPKRSAGESRKFLVAKLEASTIAASVIQRPDPAPKGPVA